MFTTRRAMPVPARAPSMFQLGWRLLLLIGAGAAVAIAIWLWTSWQQTRAAHIARMDTVIKLIAAHTDHYFSSYQQGLSLLARDLKGLDPARQPAAVLAWMRAYHTSNPELVSVSLYRPDGRLLVSTTSDAPPSAAGNPDWRADAERGFRSSGLSIDRPQTGYLTGMLVLQLRYAVRNRAGQLRYLIQVGLPLEHQQTLWRGLGLMPDIALGLFRFDGYLISRIPGGENAELYYRQNLGGALYAATRDQSRTGHYEGTVLADGSYRIGVYQQLVAQPIYVFMSHQRSTLAAAWWEQVRWPLLLTAGFLLASMLIYWRSARRYARRMLEIEKEAGDADSGSLGRLPSSGVREIDTLVTALAQSREKLHQTAQNREKLLLTAAAAGTYVVHGKASIVSAADRFFLSMLGRRAGEVVGRSWNELVSADSGHDSGPPGRDLSRRIFRVLTKPGERQRWIATAEYPETGSQGEEIRYGVAIDVSERERLLDRVNAQSQRFQALWNLASTRDSSHEQKLKRLLQLALDVLGMDMVLLSEIQDHMLHLRLAAERGTFIQGQLGCSLQESLCRRAIERRETQVITDLGFETAFSNHPVVRDFGMRGFVSVPVWVGGALYGTMAFLSHQPFVAEPSPDDRGFMELLATWCGQLMFEEYQHDELERMAMTDALTGLINRRAAESRFAEELARGRRLSQAFSVAVCDLDRFKLINDHYGHDVGDQVLVHVAALLRDGLREADWAARWGGEEFIVFLNGMDGPAAHQAMERLRQTIKGSPVSTQHGPLEITTSIGIGSYRGAGDLSSVLSEADGCLYEAKIAGRDRVVMSESSRRGKLWKAGMLQHALHESRVVPAYQVIVDLHTEEVVADEALARLVEPDGRIVVAGEFVEAAEGINLVHVVDEAVSRQAMQRCAINLCNGVCGPGFMHFINLSPQFLARRELVQAMLRQAAQHCQETGQVIARVKPVVLEITERQLIGNFEELKRDLQPLLDFGFRLALDDFGSGYSSFLYLASLPISFLKIEGWMVQNMRTNPRVLGMVKSIVALARDQGITTIAECVEDAETVDLLRTIGADWAQGYYFGRPQCNIEMLQPRRARQERQTRRRA